MRDVTMEEDDAQSQGVHPAGKIRAISKPKGGIGWGA